MIHGDEFDGAVCFGPLLKATGSAIYTMLLWLGRYVNLARGLFGLPYRPQVACIDDVLYCNDGDWVDHCTALVEDRHGELSLWSHQSAEQGAAALEPALRRAA